MSGLQVQLGALDARWYAEHLEPVFVELHAGDVEPLLLLAEQIVDAAEALGPGVLSETQQARVDEAEALLAWVERAEDQGFTANRAAESSVGNVLIEQREVLLRAMLMSSRFYGSLLRGEPLAEGGAGLAWHPRSTLQYWILTMLELDFPGDTLVEPGRFLRRLARAEERDRGCLFMLRGAWWQLPPFTPRSILSSGTEPGGHYEIAPLHDWSIITGEGVAAIRAQLELALQRFIHLEFLRHEHPELHRDVRTGYDPDASEAFLHGYGDLIVARPWSASAAALWDYVDGVSDTWPEGCRVLDALPVPEPETRARDLFRTLRTVLAEIRAVHDSGMALVVFFCG